MKKKTIGKEYIFTALILFVVLAVTMVLDSQLPSYHIVIKVIKKASVYSLVAVSMNLLNGFTGLFSLGQAHGDKVVHRFSGHLLDGLPDLLLVFLHPDHAEDVRKARHLRDGDVVFNLQILRQTAQRLQIGPGQVVVDNHLGVGAADGLDAQRDIHLAAGDRSLDQIFQLFFQISISPRHTGRIFQKTMVDRADLHGDLLVADQLARPAISRHAAHCPSLWLLRFFQIWLHAFTLLSPFGGYSLFL